LVANFWRSVIVAELWRPEIAKKLEIVVFSEKATPYSKIVKILFLKFSSRHRSTLCLNLMKVGRPEIGEIVRCLPDKKNKISPGSLAVATPRTAPKICQGQPPTI